MQDLDGLKLREISVLLDLVEVGSMRELARRMNLQAGQISKIIKSVESRLGKKIITRTAHGVHLTAYGTEILPHLQGIRENHLKLTGYLSKGPSDSLTIATTSFFSARFIPHILSELETTEPSLQCQVFELPPSQFIAVGVRSGFNMCLHLKDLDWPKTWVSVCVGHMRWQLYARKGHPILRNSTLKDVLKHRFVYPIYWTNEGIRSGNDNFPISINRRLRGFETATAIGAAQIVSRTQQIGFLPHLVAESTMGLERIELKGLRAVQEPVYLTVKAELVKRKIFDWFIKHCQGLLS